MASPESRNIGAFVYLFVVEYNLRKLYIIMLRVIWVVKKIEYMYIQHLYLMCGRPRWLIRIDWGLQPAGTRL